MPPCFHRLHGLITETPKSDGFRAIASFRLIYDKAANFDRLHPLSHARQATLIVINEDGYGSKTIRLGEFSDKTMETVKTGGIGK